MIESLIIGLLIIGIVVYVVRRIRRVGSRGFTRGWVGGAVDQMQSFPQRSAAEDTPSTSGTLAAPTREAAQQILGRVKAGEERLAVSVLAEEMGVSQSEVRRAIADLRARGLITI